MTRSLKPFDKGTVHFCGIGGIGMSGIAEVLYEIGYQVQGSDLKSNDTTKRLQERGIRVIKGQTEENLIDENGRPVELLVASAAVPADNPEIISAKSLRIPIMDRAEMLGEIMRLKWSIGVAGTHGKTTTTTLVSAMLDHGGYDPTVINGGIVNAYGANSRHGEGEWIVAEACEAYGSILHFRPTIGVVTNIDPEHLDYYKTFDNLKRAFRAYLQNLPFYGFGVVCIDDHNAQSLLKDVTDRSIYTYGTSPQADCRARNIRIDSRGSTFDLRINGRLTRKARTVKDIFLPMPGRHNVLNSLAAITIGLRFDMSEKTIKETLANFTGVKRRFTKTGEVDGITIIDDYGHHPVEIKAVLKAARESRSGDKGRRGKIIAVFQPHRYSRLNDLFDEFCNCFNDADIALITDIYAAGEKPIKGREKEDLAQGMTAAGHRKARAFDGDIERLANEIIRVSDSGDLVICLGAGSISKWANALPDAMKALKSNKSESDDPHKRVQSN